MSLRRQVALDTQGILEDAAMGAGWPLRITPPGGTAVPITGFSNDIHLLVDADTGQGISARTVTVAISLLTLAANNMQLPRNIADLNSKPWLVQFDNNQGQTLNYKVVEVMPDQSRQEAVLILGRYNL